MISTVQIIYLIKEQPYIKKRNQYIEVFNETCIMMSAIMVLELMNPDLPSSSRDFLGWALIIVVSINVGINVLIVSRTVSKDLHVALLECYELS